LGASFPRLKPWARVLAAATRSLFGDSVAVVLLGAI
jgi:hypothetical protein